MGADEIAVEDTFWAFGANGGLNVHLFLPSGKTACGLKTLYPQSYHISAEEAEEPDWGCGRCNRTKAAVARLEYEADLDATI